jgi:hypothetical protein
MTKYIGTNGKWRASLTSVYKLSAMQRPDFIVQDGHHEMTWLWRCFKIGTWVCQVLRVCCVIREFKRLPKFLGKRETVGAHRWCSRRSVFKEYEYCLQRCIWFSFCVRNSHTELWLLLHMWQRRHSAHSSSLIFSSYAKQPNTPILMEEKHSTLLTY